MTPRRPADSAGPVPEAAAAPVSNPPPDPTAPADSAAPPTIGAAADALAGLTALQVLRTLGSSPRGLTDGEAAARLDRAGGNTLPAWRAVPWPRRFLRSTRDPFTAVLLLLGVVSSLVASWGTACVILALVLVSCVLRTFGEHRAARSMAALRGLVATTVTVLRRDTGQAPPRARELPVDELVPGDVIRIGPGDLVPADVRLLRAAGLTVQQSALTGESVPVVKEPVDTPGPAPDGLLTRPELCFQGSSVASGTGTAVVLATGQATQFARAHTPPGPQRASAFDRSVHGISWTLVRFMLLTPPLVLMAGAALRGRGLETLPFAVAVAVGLTPEMLPVIVTTCLARGAARLARAHDVIVRRLPALHDLGAMDVLCLDKTGTLTQDRPVVDGAFDAEGRPDPGVAHWAAVNAWWTLNLADLPSPDALDEAILTAAAAPDAAFLGAASLGPASLGTAAPDAASLGAGSPALAGPAAHTPYEPDAAYQAHEPYDAYEAVSALPFDPLRRLSTAVVRTPGVLGSDTLVVKGAVESVVERCALTDAERLRLLATAADHADQGLRVLAVATAERRSRPRGYTTADERGLTFRGFLTFRDALAPTADEALRGLAEHGVTVKVLTGDHPGTAARTCQELGLELDPDQVRRAEVIDGLSDADLADLARRTTVFARCTPAHKARIIAALRAAGHTTGFLGDGVNDLAALRSADVGIAPCGAADFARESADAVLTTKDLTAVDHAVLAGRHSSGNISSYLRITLSSNLGNVIAMLAAGLILPFLPMLPTQVLVQNLCFDAAQLAFAYDRPAGHLLRRPAALRPHDFLRFITGFGLLGAAADLATFAVLAWSVHGSLGGAGQESFHAGWFTENLLTQALVMVLLRTGRRAAEGRTPSPVRWAATALAVLGVLIPLTPVGPWCGMSAPPPAYYPLLAAVLALYALALVAVRNRYARHQRATEQQTG
ncbi:HAD-IC family P-type ATPase [Streptomyces sp. 796.1]|uniref:HAD-IC family P-type ATPase n=1 Tax=Streptomyces sp. 796.1 TaxID=3163029 RepID=UPI0039C9AEC6